MSSEVNQIMARASELLAEHGVRWCLCEALWERTWDWVEAQATARPSSAPEGSGGPLRGSEGLLPTPEDVAGYYLIQLSGLIRKVGNSRSAPQSEAELTKLEEMRNG